MVEAVCINIFRQNELIGGKAHSKIIGYELQDDLEKRITVTPEQLKDAIANNKIEIKNLTLTSDNRLVTKKITIPYKIDGLTFEDVINLNKEARMLTRNCIKLSGKYEFEHMGCKQYMIEYEDIALYKVTRDRRALKCEATPYDIICMIRDQERYVDNLEIMREAFNKILDVN